MAVIMPLHGDGVIPRRWKGRKILNTEFYPHFTDEIWTNGQLVHTHLGRCILCNSSDGETVVRARVDATASGLRLIYEGVGNRLCTECRAKHTPLSRAMRRRLDRLNDKIWPQLKKLAAPVAQASSGTQIRKSNRRRRKWPTRY